MKNKTWWIAPLIAVLIIVGMTVVVMNQIQIDKNVGSVVQGSEYHATNTAAFGSDSTLVMAASEQGTAVILGNIVVASTTAFRVEIYDATSTAAVTAGVYSTLVGTLEPSITEGTYTFDASLQDGLVIVNEASYDGSYIIMYR